MGPLKKLRSVKKISEEDWESSGGKKAFETLKEVLSNMPVLHNLDWAEPFFLETDALQYGVGVVLFQKGKDGGETNDKASSGEAHAQLLIQKLY